MRNGLVIAKRSPGVYLEVLSKLSGFSTDVQRIEMHRLNYSNRRKLESICEENLQKKSEDRSFLRTYLLHFWRV